MNMVVGIMSMQRIKNYGSFMQAYSLKKNIESLGHKVVFVDYKVEKALVDNNTVTKAPGFFKKCINYMGTMKYKNSDILGAEQCKMYEKEYYSMLGLTHENNCNEKVDILVIGSDEVFNCCQANADVGYSKQLFGENCNAKKIISYAASCGFTTVELLSENNIKSEISKMLKNNFSAISVRDKNTYDVVTQLTNKEPILNLDPVLITDIKSFCKPINPINKPYLMVYGYTNRIKDDAEIQAIKRFARSKNLMTVSVGVHQYWTDYQINANPFELLSYFKGASYVVTDTFHGTIFSVKFNKPFCSLVRVSNKNKLTDLLQRLGLEHQMVTQPENISIALENNMDYNAVNNILETERNKALEYLSRELQSV